MADNITPNPQGVAGPNPADANPPYSFEQPRPGAEGYSPNPYGQQSWPQASAYPPAQPYGGQMPQYPGGTPPQQYGAPLPPAYQPYGRPRIEGATESGTNILAIVSLVFGILSFFMLPMIGAIVAVVCGHIGVSQIEKTGAEGRSMAIAGLSLGYANIALIILVILLAAIF
ncbi:MAG: DUF4190 domain-containing protein [Lawsonella sp.]|nr:DUF4190 domain-containing protein [Mycobacteriales bacterium]